MAEGMKDYLRSAAIAAAPFIGAAVGGIIGYCISGPEPESYRVGIGAGANVGALLVSVPVAASGTEL